MAEVLTSTWLHCRTVGATESVSPAAPGCTALQTHSRTRPATPDYTLAQSRSQSKPYPRCSSGQSPGRMVVRRQKGVIVDRDREGLLELEMDIGCNSHRRPSQISRRRQVSESETNSIVVFSVYSRDDPYYSLNKMTEMAEMTEMTEIQKSLPHSECAWA